MGIGGHMLGERKLRRLRRLTGLDLDRAFRRGQQCEGRVIRNGRCEHYEIDWESGVSRRVPEGEGLDRLVHWTSCPGVMQR